MKKLIPVIIVLAALLLSAGCRGKRTVDVVVTYTGTWMCTLKVDSDTSTHAGTNTKTFNLGDSVSSVTVDAYITDTGTGTLTVQIFEKYEPGFLYLDKSTVMDEETTTGNLVPATAKYSFSESN